MPAPFDKAASPVFEFVDQIESFVREGERSLVQRAEALLDQFEQEVQRSQAPQPTIKPARYALAMHLDQRIRQVSGVRLSTWGVLAQQSLFEGQDITPTRVADFQRTAETGGPAFAGLADFLRLLQHREGRGAVLTRKAPRGWRLKAAGAIAGFVLLLVSYAVSLEYRFHARISDSFEQDLLQIGLDREPQGAELAMRLADLAEARDRVIDAAQFAPFRRVVTLPVFDSAEAAVAAYRAAVRTHVPRTLTAEIDSVLATEGDGLKLYDALRAWAILSGDTPWDAAYLSSWMADHADAAGLPGFERHVAALEGPPDALPQSDPEVFTQAQRFAAETSEVDRVWQELRRAAATQALPGWHAPVAVPGAQEVLQRRSGAALEAPIAGLFTQAGWAYARDFGIGIAVRDARALAPTILGTGAPQANDTPDRVQDRLHRHTLDTWQAWLRDLRVRPFTERDQAIRVTGALAQRDNPLTRILRVAWDEAGGNDRTRTHPHQLDLARSFGPALQYVDGPDMAEITQLFSRLNVALGSMDIDSSRGMERLMSVQDRARSIRVLQNAPALIVQIAEDVLAQASAAQNDTGSAGMTEAWQAQVYARCRQVIDGQYPFAEGPDADPAGVASLLAPNGGVMRFFSANLEPYIDQSATPWRWKPEARFQGLTPDSAAFFERAVTLSQALFNDAGDMQMDLTLAALAERGTTTFALGGTGVPVRADGNPASLSWPGADPTKGVQVSFRESVSGAHIDVPGHWGLHRLLDGLRLRFRDEGARVLVDLRTEEGRVFVEMGLGKPLNPLSARAAIRGFSCPPSL